MIMQKTATLILAAFFVVVFIGLLAFNREKEAGDRPAGPDAAGVTAFRYSPPPVPDTFSFAGEAVPLERPEIREQWDREVLYNYYQPHSILYIIKLTSRYFPMIEERLRANGVPADMKYLCVAESNLQNAVSRVGASGFWQFMPGTAPAYGLEVNAHVDERYHVEKSTDAACQYLKRAYAQFGSWTAAAASYNCGQGGYNAQAVFQRSRNYYDLVLPEETNRYIFRILTFKYFLTQAETLGFIVPDEETYPVRPVKSVRVTAPIANLAEFAAGHGINYKLLKLYNPWLRGRSLPARKGKTYVIHLPAGADK